MMSLKRGVKKLNIFHSTFLFRLKLLTLPSYILPKSFDLLQQKFTVNVLHKNTQHQIVNQIIIIDATNTE